MKAIVLGITIWGCYYVISWAFCSMHDTNANNRDDEIRRENYFIEYGDDGSIGNGMRDPWKKRKTFWEEIWDGNEDSIVGPYSFTYGSSTKKERQEFIDKLRKDRKNNQ